MKYKKNSLFFKLFIIAIIGISVLSYMRSSQYIVIYNSKSGEIYTKKRVIEEDKIEYKWIHSFEKIPWEEEFIILKDNSFLLKSIKIVGFGAGIPENKGDVHINDNGTIIMSNINENFPNIQWINSTTALKHIKLNGKILIDITKLPHHESIKLEIKRGII